MYASNKQNYSVFKDYLKALRHLIDLPSVKKNKDAIPKLHSSNGLMLS